MPFERRVIKVDHNDGRMPVPVRVASRPFIIGPHDEFGHSCVDMEKVRAESDLYPFAGGVRINGGELDLPYAESTEEKDAQEELLWRYVMEAEPEPIVAQGRRAHLQHAVHHVRLPPRQLRLQLQEDRMTTRELLRDEARNVGRPVTRISSARRVGVLLVIYEYISAPETTMNGKVARHRRWIIVTPDGQRTSGIVSTAWENAR